MRRLCVLLLLGAATIVAAPARAQIPAGAPWRTIESTHFRVTFTPGLEPLARHAAASAERARAALVDYITAPPRGRIDVVVSDNVDITNGSATPFPTNRIFLYVKPPTDVEGLQYLHDWMELVVAHELAHIFHIDVTSATGRALRNIFGRIPFDWPLFPALATPGWSTEGLATVVESALTPMGRLHGTWHETVVRTAAVEDTIEDIDRLSSDSPLWPGGQRVYIYGSLFLRDLERRHGAETLRQIVQATASAVIPPSLWYDHVAQRVLGIPFRTAYDRWRHDATAAYRARADTLRTEGLTVTRVLAAHGGVAAYPRFSPDGSSIVYTASDRRSTPVVRVIDAAGGSVRWQRRTSGASVADWLADGSVLAPALDYRDPEHLYYDLYRHRAGDSERLRRAARLQDLDVSADGTHVVAVENDNGTNRLVLLDADGRTVRPLTPFQPGVHWSAPRWSPAGDRIAVSRWTTGGRFDVVLLDSAGTFSRALTDGIGINADPAWTPDARFVVFSSDRTGIANLYAHELATGTLHQLTSVLTGAFSPDVSPDGRSIAFSAYHHDGFSIEVMDFDRAALRSPQPPRLPQAPLPAPTRARTVADTLAGDVAPYRAWRTARPAFWVPMLASVAGGEFIGASSLGWDLVGRHSWGASVAVEPAHGRTLGDVYYQYGGLRPIGAVKPWLGLSAARDWDRVGDDDQDDEPVIDEREDVLAASVSLQRTGWRSSASTALAGEFVRRAYDLHNVPDGRLIDPLDDLAGVRLTASFANARSYPFSISAEDGVRLQFSGRQRWDRSRDTWTDTAGVTRPLDAGYREVTAWTAAYRSLGRVSFANAVLALRASALWRDGPGASTHAVGGSSGSGLPEFDLLQSDYEFLPVRGFPSGTRRGTQAWSASAELRIPLALIARKPRPLPFFLHSLSGALFADAGDASCPGGRCSARVLGPTLLSAGAELGLETSLLGIRALLRGGAAVPLHGTGDHEPRAYLQLGRSF